MYMSMYLPTDKSLTVAETKRIFVALKKWESVGEFTCGDSILVSASRSDILRDECSSSKLEEKKKAAEYYVLVFPFANLGHLARCLYRAGEEEAIQAFKREFPKTKGNLLTVFSGCSLYMKTVHVCMGAICSPKTLFCMGASKALPVLYLSYSTAYVYVWTMPCACSVLPACNHIKGAARTLKLRMYMYVHVYMFIVHVHT